jgi:hypothetical protein
MDKILKFSKWHVPPPIIHFLVWFFIYLISFVILPSGHENAGKFRYLASIPYLIFVFSFYMNYSFLIPKFLFARKLAIYVIINLVMFILLSFLLEFWRSHALMEIGFFSPKQHIPHIAIFQGIAGFIFVDGLAVAVRSTSMWFHSKSQVQALELEKIRNELSFLKIQISPHFLFNTLNNILTLMDENLELAKKSMLQLSNLLRSVLYDSEVDSVTIKQETEFLTNYSNLMRLRYGPELNFNLEIDLNEPDAPIAPLLLIPFLENIFKHGIGVSVKDSFINIKISSGKEKITFESSNTYFPKTYLDKSGSGIGVDNIQKRLTLLYDGRYFYDCKIVDGNYITKLELRL